MMFVTIVRWTPRHAQVLILEFVRYRGFIILGANVHLHQLWWVRRDRLLDELDSGHYQLCSMHKNKT
jgi:hypothetical protein